MVFLCVEECYVGPDKGRCVHETSSSSSLGNVYAFVCKWSGEAGNDKFHSVTGCLVSYDLLQCIVCLLLELATSFTVITSLSLASALTRKHLSRKSTWDALDDGSDASCRMISCNALFAAAWTTKGKSQLQGRSVIRNCFEAGQIVRWEWIGHPVTGNWPCHAVTFLVLYIVSHDWVLGIGHLALGIGHLFLGISGNYWSRKNI